MNITIPGDISYHYYIVEMFYNISKDLYIKKNINCTANKTILVSQIATELIILQEISYSINDYIFNFKREVSLTNPGTGKISTYRTVYL